MLFKMIKCTCLYHNWYRVFTAKQYISIQIKQIHLFKLFITSRAYMYIGNWFGKYLSKF